MHPLQTKPASAKADWKFLHARKNYSQQKAACNTLYMHQRHGATVRPFTMALPVL